MPIVTLEIFPGRGKETKRNLAQNVAQAVSDTLHVNMSDVTIMIKEIEKENFSVGGELFCDK